jgi:hypothetical protein
MKFDDFINYNRLTLEEYKTNLNELNKYINKFNINTISEIELFNSNDIFNNINKNIIKKQAEINEYLSTQKKLLNETDTNENNINLIIISEIQDVLKNIYNQNIENKLEQIKNKIDKLYQEKYLKYKTKYLKLKNKY